MTDLNANLNMGFLSSLKDISFPGSGLITLEFITGAPPDALGAQAMSIIAWSAKVALPNYNTQLPDSQYPGTFALSGEANFEDGTLPYNGQPAPVGLNYGGVGSTDDRASFFGLGLLNSLSGSQTFPTNFLKTVYTWPQPYGMLPQNGDLDTDAQMGAIFFSLKPLGGIPFSTTLFWENSVGPANGQVVISYYAHAPASLTLSNSFPMLAPQNQVGNPVLPTDQKIISVPYQEDAPASYNIGIVLDATGLNVSLLG